MIKPRSWHIRFKDQNLSLNAKPGVRDLNNVTETVLRSTCKASSASGWWPATASASWTRTTWRVSATRSWAWASRPSSGHSPIRPCRTSTTRSLSSIWTCRISSPWPPSTTQVSGAPRRSAVAQCVESQTPRFESVSYLFECWANSHGIS